MAVEAARELGIRVVVTLGPGNDPAALGPQPPHVRSASSFPRRSCCPRARPSSRTRARARSSPRSAAGVPQVLLPQAADQFLNAEAGAGGGVAIAVPPAEVSAARVREALERVIGDATFRTAAERVRAEISAMPAPERGRRGARATLRDVTGTRSPSRSRGCRRRRFDTPRRRRYEKACGCESNKNW